MRTHSGDTGYSCEDHSKVLASRVMPDLHLQSRGQEMRLHCIECVRGYTSKQALVAHLRARHGPLPALGELMYVLCAKKGFKVLKTMREPMASLKGPFPCWVDGCTAGPFSFLDTWLKSMDPLLVVSNGVAYYMCVLGLQWSLLYLIVWEIWGGGNQATGQVTSHLLLTPILIVLVTCHWVVLVACHWVVLVAYSHF